jgi:ankyrin repeat protein
LIRATREGDVAAVGNLLASHPELADEAGDHGKTALHYAAEYDRPEIAKRLLEGGASLEKTTDWGQTAFQWAATMGSGRVANFLLAHGAQGLGLVTAASLGMLEQVRQLLAHGIDRGRDARSPIEPTVDEHWPASSAYARGDILDDAFYGACRNGHVDTAALLEAYGAHIDARGVFGGSALHWAAIQGHATMVRWLLDHGADTTLRDERFDGDPADWAEEGGHPELARTIREHAGA